MWGISRLLFYLLVFFPEMEGTSCANSWRMMLCFSYLRDFDSLSISLTVFDSETLMPIILPQDVAYYFLLKVPNTFIRASEARIGRFWI
jgi:hypothetical protein